jgi:hypothetical protein
LTCWSRGSLWFALFKGCAITGSVSSFKKVFIKNFAMPAYIVVSVFFFVPAIDKLKSG